MKSANKKLFVGIDEAGYGPNLGPLVIATSVWSTDDSLSENQLCEVFEKRFRAQPWKPKCGHVPLGDSKRLYQSGMGLATLESGLLALIDRQQDPPKDLAELISRHALVPRADATAISDGPIRADAVAPSGDEASLAIEEPPDWGGLPWYRDLQRITIPREQQPDEIRRIGAIADQCLDPLGIQLVAVRAVIIDENSFNRMFARLGSKGALLSRVSMELLAAVLERHHGRAEVFCDRQGGRKNYLPILLEAMPDYWFEEVRLTSKRSSYRVTGDREIQVHFSVGGDGFPPTALASMMAKYLRECLMEQFNRFWREQVTDLRPTAGYPVDAKRFRADIERQAHSLGLSPDLWWRVK